MIQDLARNWNTVLFDVRLKSCIIQFWWHCINNLSVKLHAHKNPLLGKETLNWSFSVWRPASVCHCNHHQSQKHAILSTVI
jgi:hypothetical protein